MRPHVLAAAVVLALPLMATPADAQRIRFAEMDQNGDGRITRDEWRGSARSFTVHDWNNDGVLSGEEVRIGGRRDVTEEPDYVEGRPELRDWSAQRFTRLDYNRDGRITWAEWPYDRESFNRADRNRDRVLTRAEFLGEDNIDDDRGDQFVDLDLDGNGRIERREWHGSPAAFQNMDRNNDNVLTWSEVMGSGEDLRPNDLFSRLDVDRSGSIERDEWQWSRGSFDRRDSNRDGVISRSELQATTETGAVGTTGTRQTLVVDAQTRWTDTGLDVRAGDYITIHAEGTVQMSSDPNDIADPSGARTGRKAPNSPVNTMPAGGLIAMINGSTPTFIGNRADTRIRIPATGRLYLGINDDHLLDNRGEFRVTINVER